MKTVLTISYDSKLLDTRNALLRSFGIQSIDASSMAEGLDKIQRGGYGLVIVCYSVPEADQNQLIGELRKRNSTPALLLRMGAIGGAAKDARITVIQYRPDRFVKTVMGLLRSSAA